jgi:hypothetical protein
VHSDSNSYCAQKRSDARFLFPGAFMLSTNEF